ncbi:OmpA family protein [Ichthyenterobacterium sp. W332]|uniref:OmpA family protein n=1 Tax=Microcosmobacter mediterraneus TaxID=3075607 RepID=A0ABU2YM20_9FLAO|nr:OmpA family protein [Ichthyenterobacterium sp. W332]MDT0559092.1 OmpA family protein [Ichthyenterobacterium sp. W332]
MISKFSKTLSFLLITLIVIPNLEAQTKKIKRPKSRVGISSVDTFVQESFDLYDKVYKYDGYAESGTPLDDEDIDVLEDALTEMTALSESAPNILSDLDGAGVLKQGKATLQINKAKKALKYSIKTAKELLLGQRERDKEKEDTEESDSEDTHNSESDNGSSETPNADNKEEEPTNISDNIEVSSKFDFVPGDKLLFFDDFSQDFIGDFPSKWNTNGSGEVVTINKEKWFDLKQGYGVFFIPDILNGLPEDYTIEFDLLVSGIDKKTSSSARLEVKLEDNNTFKTGTNYAVARIPLCQYVTASINLRNKLNNKNTITSSIKADIRKEILNKPHISIAVNKQRFRLWVNLKKYVDIPRMIADNSPMQSIKFSLSALKEGKERVFIGNLKVAEGGVDLRRKLLSEGRISTNGILFDSGSDKILPQSYGIIRQISQVLMQDESLKLNIIGHTDSDGSDDANMRLSKARANAVKQALITIYKISGERLETDGKGESEPIKDNATSDGKAQNRRVEFVKI